MKIILRTVMAAAGLFLFVNFSSAENLVKNGDFETGINDWSGTKLVSGEVTPAPDFISWETKDVKTGSKGSLRIKIKLGDNEGGSGWNTGVICTLQDIVPDNSVLKVSFFARKISGPDSIAVCRTYGSAGMTMVELSGTDWKHYEVDLPITVATQYIIFAPVDGNCTTKDGEFLLDDVVVEVKTTDVPASK